MFVTLMHDLLPEVDTENPGALRRTVAHRSALLPRSYMLN
jgi:hypothetical protein